MRSSSDRFRANKTTALRKILHKTSFTLLSCCLVVVFFAPLETARDELPPEAQEAFDKGVIAAKQKDYQVAIRFFQEARTLAPDAREIFFNLGLAESKIPGHELRAICWFGAYLAANPNVP